MVRRICKRLIYSSDDLMIIAMAGIMNVFYRGVTLFKAAPWEGTSRNWPSAVAAVIWLHDNMQQLMQLKQLMI